MLFQRREPAKWPEKLRVSVWPRRSWARSVKYVTKRILRITATPHAIAAGVAAGVFTSFTPFMGFHFIIAATLAYIIGGSLIASALGTFFGNPLTFPFIWVATYNTGNFILHQELGTKHTDVLSTLASLNLFHSGFSGIKDAIADIWTPIILPMMIGGIPLGIGFGILFYVLTLKAAKWFRTSRDKVISDKAQELQANRELLQEQERAGDEVAATTKQPAATKAKANLGKAAKKARAKASEIKEKGKEKISDKCVLPISTSAKLS